MKLLVIVTRKGSHNEFKDYWKIRQKPYIAENRILIIMNGGGDLRDVNYLHEEFGELIQENIKGFSLQDKIEEIGIIYHGGEGDGESNIKPNVKVLEKNYNIAFCDKYSSQTEHLCEYEGDDFSADLCKGVLPLDRLRDAVVAECKNKNQFNEVFDAVWDFFLCDRELEAKLEFLHQCLTPQGAKEVSDGKLPEQLKEHMYEFLNERLSKLNPHIAELENQKYKAFSDQTVCEVVVLLAGGASGNSDYSDCFSPRYLTALSALREALLVWQE